MKFANVTAVGVRRVLNRRAGRAAPSETGHRGLIYAPHTLCAGAAPVSAPLTHANLNAPAGSQGNANVPDATHSMSTPVPDPLLAPGPFGALYRDPAKSAKATSRLRPFEQTFKTPLTGTIRSIGTRCASHYGASPPPPLHTGTHAGVSLPALDDCFPHTRLGFYVIVGVSALCTVRISSVKHVFPPKTLAQIVCGGAGGKGGGPEMSLPVMSRHAIFAVHNLQNPCSGRSTGLSN